VSVFPDEIDAAPEEWRPSGLSQPQFISNKLEQGAILRPGTRRSFSFGPFVRPSPTFGGDKCAGAESLPFH